MKTNSNKYKRETLASLELMNLNIHLPEFQLGYRDGYTHESQHSDNEDYKAGYLHGSRDRVFYRDC